MNINGIISTRSFHRESFYDIVYEWEDEIAKCLNLQIISHSHPENWIAQVIRKIIPYVSRHLQTSKSLLCFEMFANDKSSSDRGINKPDIIPWLIDCYARDGRKYRNLCKNYKNNSLVLLSSREIYDYYKSINCPLNIEHLALSLPDKYKISPSTSFEKPFDVILLGRQNPMLGAFLERYKRCKKTDLKIAHRIHKDGQWIFLNHNDEFIGTANTREEFINITRLGKIGLYSTPGVDEEKKTNGFSQVTPRFLEYLAAGTHIMARYSDNSDSRYYELNKFSPNIESYELFERQMDYALTHDVDMKMYSEYLAKHYTSVRVKRLINILERY